MDFKMVIEFIQQVGFPIACTVALFYPQYQEMQQRQKDAEERAKQNAEFMRIIAENTAVTNSLKDLVNSLHRGDM